MAAPSKKTSSKSVTFGQEAADQTLLTAIEEELAEGHFSSFSELCKQALQFFLFEDSSAHPASTEAGSSPEAGRHIEQQFGLLQQQLTELSEQMTQLDTRLQQPAGKGGPDAVVDEIARLSQQTKQMTQQLTQLQRQLEDFEPAAGASFDPKQFRQLENQMGYLTQQVDQIDGTTSQLVSQMEQFSGLEPKAGSNVEQLGQLEDQITDLMGQVEQLGSKTDRFLTHLQEVFASTDGEAIEDGVSDLSPGVERLEQLESRLTALLDRFERSVAQGEVLPVGRNGNGRRAASTVDPMEVDGGHTSVEVVRSTSPEADPLLHRLSAFLEDF